MLEWDYIYEVYKEGSFTAAAKKLFLSQPALSAAVRKAEGELGVTVFDRSASPLRLTEEGRAVIEAAKKIRAATEELSERLSDLTDLRTGHLTVSGENYVSSFLLPRMIRAFSAAYPGIEVELVESNSPNLREQLLTESIDLLVAHDFEPDLFTSRTLSEECLLIAVPASFAVNERIGRASFTREEILAGRHLAADAPRVSVGELADEPFLLLKAGNDMYRRATAFFEEEGVTPQVKIRFDQLITSYNCARGGLGVAFVTDEVVKNAGGEGCLYYLPKGKNVRRTFSIGYKKNRYLSRAMSAFIEIAQSVVKE